MSILSDLNPTSLAIKAAVVVAAVAGAFAYGHHVGYTGEKLVYDKYVSDQKAAAEAQVAANKTALDAIQQKQADDTAKLTKAHNDEITSLTAQRDAAVTNSSQYADKLRQYLNTRPSSKSAGVSNSVASTSQSSAASESAGGLSDGVSDLNRYLAQRFYTADVNASALNEAIDLLAQDRSVCNGQLPGITQQ